MKIVVLDAYTTNPGDLSWATLESLGQLTIYDRTSPDQTVERALEADAVLTNKVVLDKQKIDALPNLKYIGVLATGTNVVDLSYARSKGIVVTNAPSYSTESVVQTTFAHILNLATRLVDNTTATRSGEWVGSPDFSFSKGKLTEISQKQLGIVGFGTIGRRVAQAALAFGMKVVAYGPRLTGGQEYNGVTAVDLDELFATSDVVSLHCPLTEATRALVDAKRLAKVKRGAWLINTGRGPLLDEQAVADALNSGQLGGLGVDVLSTEPPKESNPLLSAPNCFITPHNAWASYEARSRLIQIVADNLKAFVENRVLNVVN
ncbi:MAG: D-2-hydroxyacid dehydrogenase [Thermoguttaceae bacterium]|nr:D-2-hydroxyacid dehydrogenase [Thermoguttaceae bacterium]